MRHIISLLLENESGALSRVSGLFSARGYNIESVTVAPTNDRSLSRMTIVTSGTDEIVEQITKQLNKLVDVVRLSDLTESSHVERELLLIKVRAEGTGREEIRSLVDIFRGQIVDVTEKSYIIQLTGDGQKIDAFMNALGEHTILEVARSGATGIARGEKVLRY
ncbi:acetolactate synthase small subunit [Halofilum ochraceum]|jgi:acetolactate synthase-1/3 small subunit|uniref:acetolactate synthase small subunit n=1 Tax=Halofilum ochraceum TaxID=1611323 RepID=UPI000830775E|nr:acetolactate synthase small subunit [Halofilum ochraceum]